MRMKKLSWLLLAALPVLAQAQNSPPATLKEIAQRAVLNSPEVTSNWQA